MNDTADTGYRAKQRLIWARHATDQPTLELERASSDAGFRSYWRTRGMTPSRIVMDCPPDKEDIRPWLYMQAMLHDHGIRVPQILGRDLAQGFLLLEDLGGPTCAQAINDNNADATMHAAIAQLLRLQSLPLPASAPVFGESLLQRDASLFEDWFVRRHLQLELDCGDVERLQLAQRRLMDNALEQAAVPTHRDYMLRNLMPAADGPAVLDFQDLVLGPIAYDPVSLMRDAFLSWPEPRVTEWLTHYHAQALQAQLPVPDLTTFLRDADWCGVQRHLKILGIFARLHYRDNKPRYLEDAPRFIAYLDAVVPRYPALQPLQELLDRTLKPAFARIHS